MDKARFYRLWRRCGGQDGAAVFAELAAHYREPHRFYHTAAHIVECLERMDLAAAELTHSDSVELAVWFHDVIYQCGASDNEQQSADWFAARAAGIDAKVVDAVCAYIVSTTHGAPPREPGAQFVVDVDLSGLGMSAAAFDRDGDNIRKEFAHLNDADFFRGQNAFLQSLLDREHIYCTRFFQTMCESRARENIRNVLARTAHLV